MKFKERQQEAYRQAKVGADAVEAEFRARIDASDGEPVPLSQQGLDAIRLYEALKIQKNESYRNLNDVNFYLNARGGDGCFFFDDRASILFESEGSGTILHGSDINYYNLGFAAASTGRGTAGMSRAIVIWNLGQILFRGANPAHNLRKIPIGIDWMKEGHSFYLENRIRQ